MTEDVLQRNIFQIIEICNLNSDHMLKEFNTSKNAILPIPYKVLFIIIYYLFLKIVYNWGYFVDKLVNMFHND